MRIRARPFVLLAIILVAVLLALAVPWPWGNSRVVFRPLALGKRPGIGPYIGNGIAVDPARFYPAALASEGEAQCSATLVGPDAMLTAAHCVRVAARIGEPIGVELRGRSASATCEASPTSDFALCKVTPALDGIDFDSISRTAAAVHDQVTLTGWAEQASAPLSDRLMHRIRARLGLGTTFREGSGRVESAGPLLHVQGASTPGGRVVADLGDSGGAAYVKAGSRVIVGVNVCGGPGCPGVGGANAGTTTVANLTDGDAATWVRAWVKATGAIVCGFSTSSSCRP